MSSSVPVSGYWHVRLDPEGCGVESRWFDEQFDHRIQLPGSLDEAGIGTPVPPRDDLSGLSRKVRYVGAAWYSREVLVPADWVGQRVALTLERVHWFSTAWVNGTLIGSCDSLSTPHVLEFTPVSQALHLVLCIDNTPRIPIGTIGHSLTDWTQTNWNGVIGEMRLDRVGAQLDAVSVTTGLDVARITGRALGVGTVAITVRQAERATRISFDQAAPGEFSRDFHLQALTPWSVEHPVPFDVTVELEGQEVTVSSGRRSITAEGKSLRWNDIPLFLRGTLECCVFPQTGYPPTDLEPWRGVMLKVREYGLNHIRFHSWCPPEAAFTAADEIGVIVQVELPLWTGLWAVSSSDVLMDFCRREAHRILSTYGHHPSFGLFALGNEIAFYGPEPEVDRLINELKLAYPNRLYAFSAQGTELSDACDYFVQADNGKPGAENRPLRGSTWFGVGSRFTRERPCTLVTCDEAAAQFDRPVISHEVGEWCVFPDVYNARSYRGVLSASNFETISSRLEARGMEAQAPQFVQASGKLSAQLYKEEVETLLRTQGLSGYQLLGLSDFPGQGTATVGMLDAFWQEKGFVTGADFRRFCAPTVPLASFRQFVWESGDKIEAEVSAFHRGAPRTLEIHWSVLSADGQPIAQGSLGESHANGTENVTFPRLVIPTEGWQAPAKYRLELFAASDTCNSWPIWVFPKALEAAELRDVDVFEFYRQDVRDALRAGHAVWLRLNPKRMWGGLSGRFDTAFWSPVHFKEQVGTMGCVIDHNHSIFEGFPTEDHTEWHWWDILTYSKALNINAFPLEFQPIVQVIDRFERCDKLATVFEATVGRGRLLVSLIDFVDFESRPAARALHHSICGYLNSDQFQPSQRLSIDALDVAFAREP